MAAPSSHRIHWTAKPGNALRAWLPGRWQFILDLDGTATAYLRTWRRHWFKDHDDPRMTRTALETLQALYFLQSRPANPPARTLAYRYTATYAKDALAPASMTLLQLGVQARFHLVVHDGVAAFAVATDRPMAHVLRQYFSELEPMHARVFDRVERGRIVNPKRLTRFLLPDLPGTDATPSLPLPMPLIEATEPPTACLGKILSPLTRRPIGDAELALKRLTRGTLVAGTTGSGKTNTVLHLIEQAREHAWVLAFDVKREYRSLHKTAGATVLGFTGQNLLTHNLLKPVGPPAQWAKEFASILSEVIHRHAPAVGSKDVVTEELDRLYRQRGVYDDSRDYPHIGDLVAALQERQEKAPSRETGWISSALRVLRSLMVGSTRQAFCVRQGLALERLMDGVTVIELDGIGDPAATSLLASVLLQKIRNHHVGAPAQDALRGLVVFEEAQHLLAQGSEATSVLATTCREIRSTGIGLVYVTQMPSDFSKHALANVNTLIVHRLLHPPDRSLVARMMDLDPEHRRVFGALAVGTCVVHAGQVWLVRVPEAERPVVRDEQLPAIHVEREDIATSHARRRDTANRVSSLSPAEWGVLEAVAEGRAVSPRALVDETGASVRGVTGALGKLIRKGLVRYRPARRDGPGRPPVIHFATATGQEAYRARHGQYPDRARARIVKHAEVVERVCVALGVQRLPHRRFDILYDADGRKRAVEVETGSNHDRQLAENLVKSLEFQGEAWFVTVDEVTRNRVLQASARHCYDDRADVVVHVALVDDLPAWRAYSFEAVPSTL